MIPGLLLEMKLCACDLLSNSVKLWNVECAKRALKYGESKTKKMIDH
jgi:hypothetical protein